MRFALCDPRGDWSFFVFYFRYALCAMRYAIHEGIKDGRNDSLSQSQAPARPDLLHRVEWLPILLADCWLARSTGDPVALRPDRDGHRHA